MAKKEGSWDTVDKTVKNIKSWIKSATPNELPPSIAIKLPARVVNFANGVLAGVKGSEGSVQAQSRTGTVQRFSTEEEKRLKAEEKRLKDEGNRLKNEEKRLKDEEKLLDDLPCHIQKEKRVNWEQKWKDLVFKNEALASQSKILASQTKALASKRAEAHSTPDSMTDMRESISGSGFFSRLGSYPEGYDSRIHGAYDPRRYYGKPDTPFGQVKLKDLPDWLQRRDKSPIAISRCISRAYWRWSMKYFNARKSNSAPFIHVIIGSMLFFYTINYGKIKNHYDMKYH